jgi:hypothetical protein
VVVVTWEEKEAERVVAEWERVEGERMRDGHRNTMTSLVAEALGRVTKEADRLQGDCSDLGACADQHFPCEGCLQLARLLGTLEGRAGKP